MQRWYLMTTATNKLKDKYLVKKRNILNQMRDGNMTLQEHRFFCIYLSKINPNDISTRVVRFSISDFKAVMEYMKQGTCPVDELISAIYTPEEAQTALEKWSANPGEVFRILIRF